MTDAATPRTTYRGIEDPAYRLLAARFRPVFARVAEGSLAREQAEVLAHDELRLLTEAGFGRLRTPVDLGGFGARLSDLLRLLAELAEVDVNLAHIWRNHYSFVEDRLHALAEPGDDGRSRVWLERLGRGEIIGGGWSEAGPHTQSTVGTTIVPVDGGWSVSGVKHYATGSVYAGWFTVLARDPSGAKTVALVAADQPGVTVNDDWDGFGQRLTGSGSVTYRDAFVEPGDAIPYASRYDYQAQYYQSVLHSLLIGIGRAVVRDGVDALLARRRSHDNGTTASPAVDPQILEAVGRLSALQFAAEGAFALSIAAVDEFVDGDAAVVGEAAGDGDAAVVGEAAGDGEAAVVGKAAGGFEAAAVGDADADGDETGRGTASWLAVAQAQSVITDSVLEAATLVFDVLGASGTSRSVALDRHWRNARTLASHNPRIYKNRLVGDLLVNGADPAGH